VLIWLEAGIERARIWFAQRRQGRREVGHLVGWVGEQKSTIVAAVLLAALALWLDTSVLAEPAPTPGSPPDLGLRDLLTPTVAFAGVEFALLVSTWFLVSQFAANRYQSASVVNRLASDWSSALILRWLAVAILVGLVGISATASGVAPRVIAVLPAAMVAASLPMLLTFRSYGLVLFQPTALARAVRQQTEERVADVASASRMSRSVASHLRRLTVDDWRVWEELLAFTADRDRRAHLEIVRELAHMTMSYLERWWHIDARSRWFPAHRVPMGLDPSFAAKQQRHIFEGLALGEPWREESDHEWFQREALAVLARASRAGHSAQPAARSHVLSVLGDLLVYAWQRQEMPFLERVETIWERERRELKLDERDEWLSTILDALFAFIDNVMRRRFALEEHFPLREYPDASLDAPLPALVRAQLRDGAASLEAETALAGKIVTPLDELSRAMQARLREVEREATVKHGGWVVAQAAEVLSSALDANVPETACDLARSLTLMVDRAWELDMPTLADAALDRLVAHVPRIAQAAGRANYETRRRLEQQARILALRAIVARRSRVHDSISVALTIASVVRDRDGEKTSETSPGMPLAIETVGIVGGLAFAAGEIRDDHRAPDHVRAELQRLGWSIQGLGKLAKLFDEPGAILGGPAAGLTLEYHRFVTPLWDEAEKLGRVPLEGGPEAIPMMVLNTKSEWLRRRSLLIGIDITECIAAFLRWLAPAPAAGSEGEPTHA
jgi:hypothetical protein